MTAGNAPSEDTVRESMSTRKFRESLGTEYGSRYDAATIAKKLTDAGAAVEIK